MRIIACHLLNDYSGSPKVLSQLVKGWLKNNYDVTLLTCANRDGFLSNINGVSYNYYWYKWSGNKLIRLLFYTWSQVLLFFRILTIATKKDLIYVNTILPFGAALAGKIKGCQIVYHVHETSIKPKILNYFLFKILNHSAHKVVFVSRYVSSQSQVKICNTQILYNAIENDFIIQANNNRKQVPSFKNVLMISSLKVYKGVFEFIEVALRNPYFEFRLVLNASQSEIDSFFRNTSIPSNVTIYTAQTNIHKFYAWADVVLNLSRPTEWVETFGLTVIEAMAYHLPVIVPTIGGITELVNERENGFLVDSTDTNKLSYRINQLLTNSELYFKMQIVASNEIKKYKEDIFISESLEGLMPQQFVEQKNRTI